MNHGDEATQIDATQNTFSPLLPSLFPSLRSECLLWFHPIQPALAAAAVASRRNSN